MISFHLASTQLDIFPFACPASFPAHVFKIFSHSCFQDIFKICSHSCFQDIFRIFSRYFLTHVFKIFSHSCFQDIFPLMFSRVLFYLFFWNLFMGDTNNQSNPFIRFFVKYLLLDATWHFPPSYSLIYSAILTEDLFNTFISWADGFLKERIICDLQLLCHCVSGNKLIKARARSVAGQKVKLCYHPMVKSLSAKISLHCILFD